MARKRLTVQAVADELGLNVSQVYRLIHAGDLQANCFGGPYRVEQQALDTYIQKTRVKKVGRPVKNYESLQGDTLH